MRIQLESTNVRLTLGICPGPGHQSPMREQVSAGTLSQRHRSVRDGTGGSVTPDEFLRLIARVRTFKRGNKRAPHKPLLLLFALGRVLRHHDRLIPYADVERRVGELLRGFGSSSLPRPQYPFRWLLTDHLWEIPRFSDLSKDSSDNLSVRELRRLGIEGGFPQPVYDLLLTRPELARLAAWEILREHFPASLHRELLDAAGIRDADVPAEGRTWEGDLDDGLAGVAVREREIDPRPEVREPPTYYSFLSHRRRRDPLFRRRVLEAYEERCAVCDLDIRLGERLLGLEAAHIQWHSHGGPDQVANGLALCLLHHKALDRGAMGLEERKGTGFKVVISGDVRGERTERLVDFRGSPIRRPRTPSSAPALSFVAWHRREVFRSPRTSGGTDGTR